MAGKKSIISASRRCDIPAFMGDWFLQQLAQGYCLVKNPFNPKQITKVSLAHEDVAAFIFWTRNPEPFFPAIKQLQKQNFGFAFMITVNGYGLELEPGCPSIDAIIKTIARLARTIGRKRIVWRYDPIIISDQLTFAWHRENFSALTTKLAPHVSGCIVSLIDYYRKSERNLRTSSHQFIKNPESMPGFAEFLKQLHHIASDHKLELSCCCESIREFGAAEIPATGCINPKWIEKITGSSFSAARHKGQRPDCQCCFSRDIGSYGRCEHGCRYCYASR